MKNYFGENEIILAHGTAANPDTILKGGFDNIEGFWNCSEFNQVYFYEYKEFCRVEGYDLNGEDVLDILIRRANEQGQIQNAVQETPENFTSVFEFHFPEEFKKEIKPDDSCANMASYGSVQVNMATINKYMKQGKCKVIVHKFPFCIKCSLLYLTSMFNNPYAETSLEKLPQYEREVLETLAKGEFNDSFWEDYISYPDEIESYEPNYPMCVNVPVSL